MKQNPSNQLSVSFSIQEYDTPVFRTGHISESALISIAASDAGISDFSCQFIVSDLSCAKQEPAPEIVVLLGRITPNPVVFLEEIVCELSKTETQKKCDWCWRISDCITVDENIYCDKCYEKYIRHKTKANRSLRSDYKSFFEIRVEQGYESHAL